jgi:Tol biopolymer transport system component
MRRVLFASFLIFITAPALIFAQRDSLRSTFLDAESWFLFEEYSEALPLYESLLATNPGNYNLRYKIGICLLNDPYQKDKSIQYLLEASNNINPSYKENTLKELSAPPDVLYFLANAYQVNELLDLAIETYERFLREMDQNVYDEELVQAQIRSCRNAQRLKTMPVDIDLTLLDSLINTRYPDIRPVISGDGKKLAFVTELPFYDGAFFTEKVGDEWTYPQMITQMLGFDANVYPVALSFDGTEMILYYDDDYIGNLYYSRLENGLWTPATKMGENISTKYWESHACFSKDGQTLYFTSNRKGTNGGLDIYSAKRQADGKWGVPENLGTTINTRYNEESPYISEDGQTLYFSSYGHYNMGGYDIFYSKKNGDGTWAEPVNIGYPINTTDDDLYFQPTQNGNAAYYSLYSPRGIGRHDIYYMNIYSVDNPRLYYVTGKLRSQEGRVDSTLIDIYVIDTDSGDTLLYTKPSKEGTFALRLKQGTYELHFKGEDYEELIRPLRITTGSNKRGIALEDNMVLQLIKEEPQLFEGEESKLKLKDKAYEGVAGTPVIVPLTAPRGSKVIIRTYQDSVLIGTDTIFMEKRRTDLQIIPLPGISEVELEMTDKEGNLHRNRITVMASEPAVEPAQQTIQPGEMEEEPGMQAGKSNIPKPESINRDSMGLLLPVLISNSGGALQDELVRLDSTESGIASEPELFEHLYLQADESGYGTNEVDILLSGAVADSSAPRLRQVLIENSEGALKEYVQQLNLEAEGISSAQELLSHLEKEAAANGFNMDQVRKAMLAGLENPLEVDLLFEELLHSGDESVTDILKSMDNRGEEVYTIDDLIELVSRELDEGGYSRKEIEQTLSNLFGENYSGGDSRSNKPGWPLLVLLFAAGAGIFWLIIAWWRRRDKKEEQGN